MPVATPTILSKGKTIDPTIELVSIQVSKEINRVPGAMIQLLDGDAANREFPVSNMSVFEPGKEIEIKLRYEGSRDATVFKGLVVGHRVEARDDGSMLHVELRDEAVRLTRARNSAVYRDQTDAEMIKKLVQAAKLKAGRIDSTQPKHAGLVQFDCTDWDFILSRADVQGLVVFVDDAQINVQELKVAGSAKSKFEWGIDEIYDFDIEADASHQIAKLESTAWDVKTQKLAKPSQAKSVSLSQGNLNGAKVAKAIGFKEHQLIHPAPLAPKEQQAWADARLARSRLSLIRGRIAIPGSAQIKPLDTIEVAGIGKRFDGRTVVSGVRHRLDQSGWQTDIQFGLSPQPFCQEDNIQDAPAAGLLPAVSGLQIGIVDKFEKDPDKELRVKVILPAIDEKSGSVWARLASPDAGKERGFLFRPEVGDEVVVGFFNNDPRQPVILGAMFSSKNSPPTDYAQPTEKNKHKGLVTKQGTTIGFVDGKKASVFIETKNKNKLLFDDDAESIQLTDQHGNSITLKGATFTAKFHEGYNTGFYRRALNDELVRFLAPWAYDDSAEIVLGGEVDVSVVIKFIEDRPYVDYLADITLLERDHQPGLPRTGTEQDVWKEITVVPADVVLVSKQQHKIVAITKEDFQEGVFDGINEMIVEFSFVVS